MISRSIIDFTIQYRVHIFGNNFSGEQLPEFSVKLSMILLQVVMEDVSVKNQCNICTSMGLKQFPQTLYPKN